MESITATPSTTLATSGSPEPYNLRGIAWTPALRAYFRADFVEMLHDRQGDALYIRKGLHPG